jgi:hypothetical protein
LTVEVASAGADDEWDPTLEVVVSGPSGPLSRLLVSDARPIEACWWQDLDGDGVPELAIGLGPTEATASGVLVYAWRDGRLDPRKVPTLRGHDGAYRYVVQGTRLYAFPVAGRQAGPPVARATYVFDFARGHWESDQPPSRASGP